MKNKSRRTVQEGNHEQFYILIPAPKKYKMKRHLLWERNHYVFHLPNLLTVLLQSPPSALDADQKPKDGLSLDEAINY